jgi:hypothetical protein
MPTWILQNVISCLQNTKSPFYIFVDLSRMQKKTSFHLPKLHELFEQNTSILDKFYLWNNCIMDTWLYSLWMTFLCFHLKANLQLKVSDQENWHHYCVLVAKNTCHIHNGSLAMAYRDKNPLKCTTHDEKDLVFIKILFYPIFWSPQKIMNQKLSNISKGPYFRPLQL